MTHLLRSGASWLLCCCALALTVSLAGAQPTTLQASGGRHSAGPVSLRTALDARMQPGPIRAVTEPTGHRRHPRRPKGHQTEMNTFAPGAGQSYVGVSAGETGPGLSDFLSAASLENVAIWNLYTAPDEDFQGILDHLSAAGQTGMISWELTGDGTLASIADGKYDSYIEAVAAEVAHYGKPIFIRPDWEFNGSWYPWSASTAAGVQRPGNSPTDYVTAWRRVVTLFKVAPNATFVWCPNLYDPVSSSSYTLSDWYPGNAYVGWIGLDAYPSSASWSYMQTAKDGLDADYAFADAHGKPMMIAEWALSSPGTGDDSTFVAEFWQWMKAHPLVKAQLWFNFDSASGTDYDLSNFPRAAAVLCTDLHSTGVLTKVVAP